MAKVLFVSATQTDEPLGIMVLSSLLKSKGHSVAGALSKKEDILAIVDKFKPEIIAFSVITGEEKELLELNKRLKQRHDFLSVWGGAHPTFSPEIIKEGCIDVVCIGEGEKALVELAENFENKKPIERISGTWAKKNNKIFKNALNRLEEDLGSFPFADREIFKRFKEGNLFNMMAVRGCPYSCTFCFNHAFNKMFAGKGKLVRARSVENVLDEIKAIEAKYPVNAFKFHDDNFVLNKKWLGEFCKKYPMVTGKPFICNVRANLVDKDIADMLKRANCLGVYMGVEAGNDRIRNLIMKRNISKEEMLNCARLFNERGIKILAQSILGIPTSTIRNDFESLYFNVKCAPFFAWVSIFAPYPKTELAKLAGSIGFKELPGTYHSKTVLNIPHAAQVNNLHKLFSLAVNYPEIIPKVKQIIKEVSEADVEETKKLRRLFLDYRNYRLKALFDESASMPESIKDFLKDNGAAV